MFKKNKLPVHLFLIFEQLNLLYLTSTVNKPNYAFIFWPTHALPALTKVLSSEVTLASSTLMEASAIDTSKFFTTLNTFSFFNKEIKSLFFYLFHFYFLSYRLIFCFSGSSSLYSVEGSYPNASWLEREFSEMYGLFFYNKTDSRNLLLDYTFTDHPLSKTYPCTGFSEIFYNPFEERIEYLYNNGVEL